MEKCSPASNNKRRRCSSGSSERPERCQWRPLRKKDNIYLHLILFSVRFDELLNPTMADWAESPMLIPGVPYWGENNVTDSCAIHWVCMSFCFHGYYYSSINSPSKQEKTHSQTRTRRGGRWGEGEGEREKGSFVLFASNSRHCL